MTIGCCYGLGPELPEERAITVLNDFEGRDEYKIRHGVIDNFGNTGMQILLVDPTGAVFSSDALPFPFPSLSEFATAEGQVRNGLFRFRLTSLNVVPEPSSWLLLSLGIAGVVMARRKLASRA